MPVKKKNLSKPSASPRVRSKSNFEIPDEVETSEFTIEDFGIMIYGQTGVGKSSLPSHTEKPFYFRFEQSSRMLQVRKTPVLTDWEDVLGWLDAAQTNLKGCRTIVIDTIAPCYDRCLEYTCKRLGISHPGKQKDYGASWKEVSNEFQLFFNKLASLDVGIWVLSHDRIEENETRSGDSYTYINPNLGGKSLEFFKNTMDFIGYYFYIGNERYLLIRGNEHTMAKCNIDNHFLTSDGEPVICIPMGNSSKEAYDNFLRAYKNLQKESYGELLVKGGFTPKKKRIPKKIQKS